jgi:hypothetical protein
MNDLKGVNSNKWPSVSKVLHKYQEFPTEEASFKKARGDKEIQKDLLKNGLIWLIMLTILVAEYTLF